MLKSMYEHMLALSSCFFRFGFRAFLRPLDIRAIFLEIVDVRSDDRRRENNPASQFPGLINISRV